MQTTFTPLTTYPVHKKIQAICLSLIPLKKGIFLIGVALFLVVVSLLSAFTSPPAIKEEVIVYLQRPLEEKLAYAYFTNAHQRAPLSAALLEVYSTNNFEPLWWEGNAHSASFDSLITALKEAQLEGLKTATYHLAELEQAKVETDFFSNPSRIAQIDQLATASYLLYAFHLYNGSITPGQLDSNWHITPKNLPLAQYLQKALQQKNVRQSLAELSVENISYKLLKQELAKLKVIALQGGWEKLPFNGVLLKNDTSQVVYLLRQRLIRTGDLDSAKSIGFAYDQDLVEAVKKFQKRHGLPDQGTLDQRTTTTLNISVDTRIEQVILNMERMRWLPLENGKTKISVNIPDYKLIVSEKDQQILEARVVVGKLGNTTPVFEDSLESIVFSPEWNVPFQIATKEILPILQRNPGYLQKNNYEVYDSWNANAKPVNPYAVNWQAVNVTNFKYRIVQKANKKNALGAVKFLFPNALNIYIHDTPAKQLFKENKRAYSHGCIRLENPGKLATCLLKNDTTWTQVKVQEHMNQPESFKVTLSEPVKVEIMYLTAFVQDGVLQFRDDVYGYDEPQLRTLNN
jgi:murein L,D-transpeptidase YcbB/YkuD